MKLSRKTGELTGKLVKGSTAAPGKTSTWAKNVAANVKDGYRSVLPKVEETDEAPAK